MKVDFSLLFWIRLKFWGRILSCSSWKPFMNFSRCSSPCPPHLSPNHLQHRGLYSGPPRLSSSSLEWCYSSIHLRIFSSPCSGMASPRHSPFSDWQPLREASECWYPINCLKLLSLRAHYLLLQISENPHSYWSIYLLWFLLSWLEHKSFRNLKNHGTGLLSYEKAKSDENWKGAMLEKKGCSSKEWNLGSCLSTTWQKHCWVKVGLQDQIQVRWFFYII